MTILLNEIVEPDYSYAETSTKLSLQLQSVITDTSVPFVVPLITLYTGVIGNHLSPADASDPSRTPLQPLILECELANYLGKAFVQQLISDLHILHGCAMGYEGPQFNTAVDDAYTIINELENGTLLSKIDLKHDFRLIPVWQLD